MADSGSRASSHAVKGSHSSGSLVDKDVTNNLYPDIPPRRSSCQHGLRFSRSGNSLGGSIDVRRSNKPTPRSGTSETKTILKSSTSLTSINTQSPRLAAEPDLHKRLERLDLSKSADAACQSPSSEAVTGTNIPDVQASEETESIPFPLSPKPLAPSGFTTPLKRRTVSAGGTPDTLPSTSDRYIPSRGAEDSLTRSYRVNKDPKELSPEERMSRTDGSNPDPFTARRATPYRMEASMNVQHSSGSPLSLTSPRTNRMVSAGAVWNVGGSGPSQQRPVLGVPDGRGGLLGSGTNAPMFSSTFFDSETPHESQERFEGRIALALDLDRTSRVYNFSHSSKNRAPPTPETSPRRPTTVWKDGRWETVKSDKSRYKLVLPAEKPLKKTEFRDARNKPRAVPSTPFRYVHALAVLMKLTSQYSP